MENRLQLIIIFTVNTKKGQTYSQNKKGKNLPSTPPSHCLCQCVELGMTWIFMDRKKLINDNKT